MHKRCRFLRNSFIFIHLFIFLLTNSGISSLVFAQFSPTTLNLPQPGSIVTPSQEFAPAMMKGLMLHSDNALQFDFIINTGDQDLKGEAFKKEATKLIKYFLVSLTVPEKDLWVNLSPYEKNRIIPEAFGITEMGRDLLAQDYLLKQFTASLIRPVDQLGKEFWNRVYTRAQKLYGTTNIPINTFNKVWIAPDKAEVYEHNGGVFVTQRHLRVMLEKDYLAESKNIKVGSSENIAAQIIKDIVIPEIEKEVNEGENFATVRQVFNSMILATWFKKRLKESLLGQVYVNQNKIKGIDLKDKQIKQEIYDQYIKAFKKGVCNYIKEEEDPLTGETIPRKYFSGGVGVGVVTIKDMTMTSGPMTPRIRRNIESQGSPKGKDRALTVNLVENKTESDVLTRMVERAPTTELPSWQGRRRDRPNTPPQTLQTISLEGSRDQVLAEAFPTENTDDIQLTSFLFSEGYQFLSANYTGSLSNINSIRVNVSKNYDGLLGLEAGNIYADSSFARLMGITRTSAVGEGVKFLFAINQLYGYLRVQGKTSKEALSEILAFYEQVQKTKPDVIESLHIVLRSRVIDSDNLFSFFLLKATGPIQTKSAATDLKAQDEYRANSQAWFDELYRSSANENFPETGEAYPSSLPSSGQSIDEIAAKNKKDWQEKWIVWFLGQRDFDSPVDLEQVDRVLNGPGSKDYQAVELLRTVHARGKYDEQNEQRNARRKLFQLLENGQSLSVSRFGRASYFLMMLAAASSFITGTQRIEQVVADLEKQLRTAPPEVNQAGYDGLVREIEGQTRQLNKFLLDIRVLIQPGNTPSRAELKGKVERLQEAIAEYQQVVNEKIAAFSSRTGLRSELGGLRNFVSSVSTQMSIEVDRLLSTIDSIPGERANFSVLIQRASKSGALAGANLFLGNDPFGGGEDLIAQAYRESGDMLYGSRDDVWFEYAQYWIEALPLMIHEEKIELENGDQLTKLVIEQEAMELALRNLAPRFKKNIDNVIDSEHVSLARVLIVQNDPRYQSDFSAYKASNPHTTDEQAALAVLRKHMNAQAQGSSQVEQEIASVAAVIDGTWRNLRNEVADLQEKEKILRYEALSRVIRSNASSSNLVAQMLSLKEGTLGLHATQIITTEDARLGAQENGTTFRLAQKRDDLVKEDIPYLQRRDIPTWIILTTQAPGMTDAFAGHWVDEDMSLYNLTTGFSYKGKALEQEAQELAAEHEGRILTIAKKLVGEFQLEHRVKEMIASGEARDEKQALARLIYDYSDFAKEVAKIFMLYEAIPLVEGQTKYDYSKEPQKVTDYLNSHETQLSFEATRRVIEENPELRLLKSLNEALGKVDVQANNATEQMQTFLNSFAGLESASVYTDEINKYKQVLARDAVIAQARTQNEEIYRVITDLITPASDKTLPPILAQKLRSQKGVTTARQEVLAGYWLKPDGTIIPVAQVQNPKTEPGIWLPLAVNDPLYNYAATGRSKKYNRGYGPSRVDLGDKERESTEKWSQWIGPADEHAKRAMKDFYGRYNMDVQAYDNEREAQAMKPFENQWLATSLAITHLSIGLFQAVGAGNLMKLMYETNRRPEVFVRAGGAGSAGFCIPKDIYFHIFVSTTAQNEILRYAGVSPRDWTTVHEVRRGLAAAVQNNVGASDQLAVVNNIINSKLGSPEAQQVDAQVQRLQGELGANGFSLSGLAMPLVADTKSFGRIGMGDSRADARRFLNTLVAGYHGKVVAQLEGINRFALINVLYHLRMAFDDARQARGGQTPTWQEAIVPIPTEYKPVSDARLSVGLRMLEYLAQTGRPHLTNTFGADGEQLADFLLFGFDRNNTAMREFFKRKAAELEITGADADAMIDQLSEVYKPVRGVGDVRMYTPFNLAAEAVNNYVSGTRLKPIAAEVRTILRQYMDDSQIDANVLTYGPDISRWKVLKDDQKQALQKEIGQRIHVFVAQVRLNNTDYRNGPGSDLWQAHKGADVFATIVHYPEMTGSEDEGVSIAGFGQKPRMIDDLARVRDTMRRGRENSALIWLDAPVQGRKPVADPIAIKQWLALGGWYVSPTIAAEEVRKQKAEEEQERALVEQLVDALLHDQYAQANEIYGKIQQLARDSRFEEASKMYDRVKAETGWYRGAGFNNISPRHEYYYEAWSKLQRGLPLSQLDLGTLTAAGLMYVLNGKTQFEITDTLSKLRVKLANYSQQAAAQSSSVAGFSSTQSAEIMYLFIKPKHEELSAEQVLTKGDSTSLKAGEEVAAKAAGQALANWKAIQKAQAMSERVRAFKETFKDMQATDFYTLNRRAQEALGNPNGIVSNEAFGRFLAYTQFMVHQLIEDSTLSPSEKKSMQSKLAEMIDGGRNPDLDKWSAFMGKGDDIGSIGRLALAAQGNKEILTKLATAGGNLDIICALLLTQEYNQMPEAQVNNYGLEFVSNKVAEQTGNFFSRTTYDHTFDYFPSWMHPAKAGNGFTDYDTIMGENVGKGQPLTRGEVLTLAANNHQWLDQYFDHLFRTKTLLRERLNEPGFAESILGGHNAQGEAIAPIGVDSSEFTPQEKEWWTYTQKREYAFLLQQGHRITGVFNGLDANALLDGRNRTNILVNTPIGRPHLIVFGLEAVDYNQAHPNNQVNLILSRGYEFAEVQTQAGPKRVMAITNGLIYVDKPTYVKARVTQLVQRGVGAEQANFFANQEAEKALAQNPKGIVVAARFKEALVNNMSVPFHGSPYYQKGKDESVGLPTTQSWAHNLFPGYAKTFEHEVYRGTESEFLYPPEHQWYQKYQYESGKRLPLEIVVDRILNGYQDFPGLRNIKWLRGISKPAKQSGGRGAIPMQLRKPDGTIDEVQLKKFAEAMAQEGYKDDQVLQKFMSSSPYLWGSPELISKIRAGLIKKGISLPAGAPLFVYSRIIVNYKDNDPNQPIYSLELIVSSRMAVSNVGLGGVLFKWQESFTDPQTAQQIMSDRRAVTAKAMNLIESSSRDFLEKIMLTEADYVARRNPSISEAQARGEFEDFHRSFPELVAMKSRLEAAPKAADGMPADSTGWSYAKPRYIMHDMLDVPIIKIDGGEAITGPDVLDVRLKGDGSLDYFVILDTRGSQWKEVKVTKNMIVGWRAVTIEHNIGYGLWNPFTTDEKQTEEAAAKKQGRAVNQKNWGAPLRDILEAWTGAGNAYHKSLGTVLGVVPTPAEPQYVLSSVVTQAPVAVNESRLMQMVEAVRVKLGPDNNMTAEQLNLILEEFALAHLIEIQGDLVSQRAAFLKNPEASIAKIRLQVAEFLAANRSQMLSTLPALLNSTESSLHLILSDQEFLGYVADGVANRIFTESMAPTLNISTRLWTKAEVENASGRPEGNRHVLVFDNLIGLADEMHRLVAAASSTEEANPHTNVMAVLTPWINPNTGAFAKAIIYDPTKNIFRLVTLDQPVLPNRVQVMRLGNNEIKVHQKLSSLYSKLGIAQVNANLVAANGAPTSAGAIADDKRATTEQLTNLAEVPEAMLIKKGESHFDYLHSLQSFILSLIERRRVDSIDIRLQPNTGTEGQNQQLFTISKEEALNLNRNHPLVRAIEKSNDLLGQDLLIREEVGNVRIDKDRRVTFRLNVTHSYPGKYDVASGYAQVGAPGAVVSSIGQGGRIVSIPEAIETAAIINGGAISVAWNENAYEQMQKAAIEALKGLNLGLSPANQLYSAGIDIEIAIDPVTAEKHFYILDVNPRATGLRHAQNIEPTLGDEEVGVATDEVAPKYEHLWAPAISDAQIPAILMDIVTHDYNESHDALIASVKDDSTFTAIADALKSYMSLRVSDHGDQKLLLKQERAILIFGDLIWALKQQGKSELVQQISQGIDSVISDNPEIQMDLNASINSVVVGNSQEDYLQFINPFLMAANQREIKDSQNAVKKLTSNVSKPAPGTLRFQGDSNTIHVSTGPMRFGISSANASDGHTPAKLRGGVVLNAAINLSSKVPIKVEMALAPEGQIELEIIGGLPGDPKRVVLNKNNIAEFYNFKQSDDPFRMLKYALIFSGIVQDHPNSPEQVLSDVSKFTNGHGLKIRVTSFGPSRSGFASSSAVSINILHAVYEASGQKEYVNSKVLLGTMALLFETELNLKSGRQDVDGTIFPLIKAIQYRPNESVVAPEEEDVRVLNMEPAQITDFQEHFMMVNTGIPRSAATDVRRGLNMRYLAYLKRNPAYGFDAIEKSFGIHEEIVHAFETGNWPALGKAFLKYMDYRTKIDPGATWSKFDKEAGEKVLRRTFDPLVEQGLIYGGMFTGAMGGGVAMLVLTDKGKEVVKTQDGHSVRRIDIALDLLRNYKTATNVKPFTDLKPIVFSLNSDGTQHQAIQGPMVSFEAAVEKYREDVALTVNTRFQNPTVVPGGITFDSAMLSLQIKRDEDGRPLPLSQQPVSNMHIEGFLPIIIKDVPFDYSVLVEQ